MKATIQEVQKKFKLISKKTFTLFLVVMSFINIAIAQCPTPTNFTLTSVDNITPDVFLDWTENGIAVEWKIKVILDPTIGESPDDPDRINYTLADSHPFYFGGLPNTNCYVYFIQSICGAGIVSQWAPVATSGCDPSIIAYYSSTLADKKFSMNENNNFKIYPNPAENELSIKFQIRKNNALIEIYDLSGRIIDSFKPNVTNEVWAANISSLTKGIYTVVLKEEGKITMHEKLVKK